jgi:ubiquinone biosynthesis protein UbiJ
VTSNNSVIDLLAKPAQALLDRGAARSTTAAALCQRLEGRTFAVKTGSAGLDMYFAVNDGRLVLVGGVITEPDAVISGSPLKLARLAGDDPEAVIREGHVQISGDADVATDFRALLDILRPDWEEELSHFTGDAIAHETGRALHGLADWAGRARRSLGRSVAEYLTEESRDLVAVTELEEFNSGVDKTAAAVERLEAKLQLLRSQLSAA